MTRGRAVSLAVLLALVMPASASAEVRVGTSGWFWSDPLPQGNDLSDLDFVGQRGYAVGGGGTILRTDDGGLSWTGLPSGGPDVRGADLSQVDTVTPETVIVPTRADCTLRRSDDGGRTFRRLRIVPRGTRCLGRIGSFSFPSPGTGYVVAPAGVVMRTTDGGASFSRRTTVPGAGGGQPRILFTSPETGFALTTGATGGRILRTVDGGLSWTQVGATADPLHALDFADGRTGYAVGGAKAALKTVDGGTTWSPVPLAGAPEGLLTEIACGAPDVCLISGYDVTLRTADGGRTATRVPTLGGTGGALDFAAPSRAVLVSRRGFSAVSDDAGATFRHVGRRLPQGLAQLRASSRSVAVAFGAAGQLALTHDDGRNWRFVGVPTRTDPFDASFANASTGFVLEPNGTILRTRNAGADWQERARVPALALLARSADTVLVAGRGGVRRSTDGAGSFRRVRSRAVRRRDLNELDPAGSAVFALGGRAVARSTDTGRSWRAIRRPTRRAIVDADFVSARVGYLIARGPRGAGARLYRTTTAGRRWSWIRSVGTRELHAVAFAGPRTGFVDVGSGEGRLLRTTDGGRSWRPQVLSGTGVNVGGLLATRTGSGIAVDSAGSIFATTTGGDAPAASSLTLRPSRRSLRRPGPVTLRGKLTPALADEHITIASLSSGRWRRATVVTEPGGSFKLRLRVRATTRFVAQWDGDGAVRGAGTRAVQVQLRR